MKEKIPHFSSDRIYLIGYMASGKSTLGRLLAASLDFDFVDTDRAIEHLNGYSIAEIFETKGEEWFREEENRILNFVSEMDKTVISVGGGLPVYRDNLSVLLHSGLTIYLELDAISLAQRIIKDSQSRPLHLEGNLEAIEKAVAKKLATRKSYYQEAHLTINSDLDSDALVAIVRSKIQGEH